MANSEKGEDSVGTNVSSSSTTSSTSSSSYYSSSSSTTSSFSFFFQSISAELDGHLKACPPNSANSTKSGSLLSLPKWETSWWNSRPTNATSSIITTTSTSNAVDDATSSSSSCTSSRPSLSASLSSSCRHQHVRMRDCQHQHQPRRHRQRLKSLTFHLTVALIFTTFTCFPILAGSTTSTSGQDESERLVCMEGFSGFVGATFPRGDIFLKEGDTLEVFCKVNLTNTLTKGRNASNMDFVFTKSDIPRDQIEKSVINETTAVVRVRHMNASNPLLTCVLRGPSNKTTPVCQNQIDVGFPPLPVEDFRCLAPNWTSLNCTWKLPSNPVPTSYTITQRWKRGIIPCPNTTTKATSCTWHGKTEPHYRANLAPIYVQVNGTNALKPSGIIWEHKFSVATIVIPEKPVVHVTKDANSLTNYVLNWTFLNFEYFSPGLDHQLSICYLYEGNKKCNNMTEKTKPAEKNQTGVIPYIVKNITLAYANTNYTISVRLRSPYADKTEEFWSDPGILYVMTGSKIPEPPETDLGSFESLPGSINRRNIFLYWKSIPSHLKNGPNFYYKIDVFENRSVNSEVLSIMPKKITEDYAEFENLRATSSYHFYISSVNSVGKSMNSSKITVPSVSTLPEEPKSVSKTDSADGTFSITWRRPGRYDGIVSYTVFHCASNKPRPPCEGRLYWNRVDAQNDETLHISYQNLTSESNHQFAVSANTKLYGSGMVWASCYLFKDRVPGKLRSVRFEDRTDDEIQIQWDLECAYQSGDIEGFKIIYCQVEKFKAEKCKDGELAEAVEGASTTTYRLKKLKPYSIYMIYVLILAAAGPSPRSDPVYARTSEGAPSPVSVVNISQVTNVSAVLSIQSPVNWNGVLREYRIYYSANGEHHEIREPLSASSVSNQTQADFLKDVALTNLRSNSNYEVNISACTTKCSNQSTPFTFSTDIGRTDIYKFPSISWKDRHMELEWDEPEYLGGPVHNFQILVKRNGELVTTEDQYPSEEYHEGTSKYYTRLPESCEPSTNFTAQIRAVTRLKNGNELYGAWSPPGNYSCGGSTSWVVWLILIIAFIVAAIVFAYLTHVAYNYFRRMKEGLAIKLPPGLNSELNGFVHKPPPRSRSSDNGKDTYAYPMQPTSTQLDESKDFLSSSELNQGEAEESLIEKPYCQSPSNPLLGELDFSPSININNLEDDENDIRLTDFSNIHPDRCSSPSTYKKLGIQCNGSAVLMEPVPGPSSRFNPSIHSGSTGDLSSSSPSHNTISQISNHLPHPVATTNNRVEPLTSNGISRTVPDVLGSSPSSPTSSLTTSSITPPTPQQLAPVMAAPLPVPAPQAPTSSYVKWTTLVPDMKTGDAGGVLENGSRQSPYCQVGILLDS